MKIELRGNYPLLILKLLILLSSIIMIGIGLKNFDYWAGLGLVLLFTSCLQALSFIKPTALSEQ
ncbi:hypothetical protein EBS43_09605 [bacterium]|nr:hypothetical protein [bacterium]